MAKRSAGGTDESAPTARKSRLRELEAENVALKATVETLEKRNLDLEARLKTLEDSVEKLTAVQQKPKPVTPVTGPTPHKKTYAEALKTLLPEVELSTASEALRELHAKRLAQKTEMHQAAFLKLKAQRSEEVAKVYISGLPYERLKELKEKLFKLRFRLSLIHNISYLGRSVVEFLVNGTYRNAFVERMKTLGFSHLENFDATPTLGAAEKKVKTDAFLSRLTSILNGTKNATVRSFVEAWKTGFEIKLANTFLDLPDLADLSGMPVSPGSAKILKRPRMEDQFMVVEELESKNHHDL